MDAILRLADWSSAFWPAMANHVWQSTLFAGICALFALLLKDAPARVRYLLWLAGLLKFAVPTAALALFISSLSAPVRHTRLPRTIEDHLPGIVQVTEPIPTARPNPVAPAVMPTLLVALTGFWASGALVVLALWLRRTKAFWSDLQLARAAGEREQKILQAACARLDVRRYVALVVSPRTSSPGLWGVLQPIVVMPEAMAAALSDEELDSVLRHELVHVQRWDNLVSCVQMVVCALFWFHPLIWMIDRILLEERELACDEKVVATLGESRTYASGLLKVVRFCLGCRVAGVSYAAHSNLRRRIERMMSHAFDYRTRREHRLLLTAAVAVLVLGSASTGLLNRARAATVAFARHQEELLGQYIAQNAARNAEYGVLIEDSTQLTWFVDGIRAAVPHVMGVTIRTSKGSILAHYGESVSDLPATFTTIDTVTRTGQAVRVFRAPVASGAPGPALGEVQVVLPRDAPRGDSFEIRGRFIAQNLAYNSEYGVLIEDATQLDEFVRAVAASAPDVVGVSVLNARGQELAATGISLAAATGGSGTLPNAPGLRVFSAAVAERRRDGSDGGVPLGEVRVAVRAPPAN